METKLGAAPTVIYEDNHLIAIDKPFGMPSQGDESGDLAVNDWVMAYIRDKYQKPGNVYVGLLHRLDRPAGGLMVLAKTSKAAERMSAMLQRHEIDKHYLIVTLATPRPKAGRLQHFVAPVAGQVNIMRAYDQAGGDRKQAALTYTVLREREGRALVDVELETGRKHQIRLQMAKIGCGVVGDARYNETAFLPDRSIALFAWKISFEHPVRKGERISLVANLPSGGVWDIAQGL